MLYFVFGMGHEYTKADIFHHETYSELYPIFSWDLFSAVPNSQKRFTIRFKRIGDEYYNPPLYAHEANTIFAERGTAGTEYTLPLQSLGYSIMQKDTLSIEAAETLLRPLFKEQPHTYDILYVTYDPVTFWREGTFTKEELIHSVSYE